MVEVSKSLQEPNVKTVRSHLLLDVICDDEQLLLAVPGGSPVAELNEQLIEGLKTLIEARTISLMALVNKKNILE